MRSFNYCVAALLALTAFASQAGAQDDAQMQTIGFMKIDGPNGTITLADVNRAVSKYANFSSITAAANGIAKSNKMGGGNPTLTVNTTANTITVTFPRNGKAATITVTGAGTLTQWGSRNPFFSSNATTGLITGTIKVISTHVKKASAEDNADAQTFLYKVDAPGATNITVTVAQMNAGSIPAWTLQNVTAVNKVLSKAATAAVTDNGAAIAITNIPANTRLVTVMFNGVVLTDKWNHQNKTMVQTPVNKGLMLVVKLAK